MGKPWENHGKMENHPNFIQNQLRTGKKPGKRMGNLDKNQNHPKNHPKTIGKPWENEL